MLSHTPPPHKPNLPPHTRTVSTLGRAPTSIGHSARSTHRSAEPDPIFGHSSVQSILVEGHADCGVHPYPFESNDFPACLDAARGNERRGSGAPKPLEPLEIGPAHSPSAIHIRAEKCGAER